MRLHGSVADDELGGDLGVREAACEQLEYLELAGGQLGELLRKIVPSARPPAVLLDDGTCDGWVEERGSKFMAEWDPHYKALLACNDRGQEPQKGGFLQAAYGRGTFTYAAYAFYRQLPAGVPGAYRLFANMISLGKNRPAAGGGGARAAGAGGGPAP